MKKVLAIVLGTISLTSSYSPHSLLKQECARKAFLGICASSITTAAVLGTEVSQAFDGAGSSAYVGRTPSSKAELKKSYQSRIAADVKDFNALGASIDSGKTDGDGWLNFFIEFQRREPDAVGRTYAGFADLIGTQDVSGCGRLLAASYGKPGKPTDGLPSVKKYNALLKAFDPIIVAGKKGDVSKAEAAWKKASALLSEFLETVEMPSSLSDPIYS